MAELRADLEAAMARLREDMQGQLWNYYGALREPTTALKDRVEQLEEKLEDFSVPQAAYSPTISWDQEAIESKFEALSSRVMVLEQQSKVASERQTQELEAMAKERAQHFALLKSRIDRVEAAELDLTRHMEQMNAAVGELKAQVKKLEAQQEGLQKQGAEIRSQSALLSKLQSKVKEVEDEVQKAAAGLHQETASREKAVEEAWRKNKQDLQTEMTKLEQKMAKLTSDSVATNKADMLHEISNQVGQVQQENATGLKKLETSLKQNISASQTYVQQQLNTQLQDMQHNLQEFLRKQDAALQQRFQKELEAHAASVKQHQDALSGKLESINAGQVAVGRTLQKTGQDLQVCQETQATFRDTVERRIGELSVDFQKVKVSQQVALSQEKITSEIRSLREGIDSIKLSVDAEKAPSRPCSPSGEVRPGPLLRPLYVRPAPVAAVAAAPPWQGVRVRSISPTSRAPVLQHAQPAVPAGFLPPASPEQVEQKPAEVISISCHSIPGVPVISGDYHLVSGETANGMPLWKHTTSDLWLYCGTNRRWFVGGHDAKDWKFRCEAGFIYSEPVPNGAMPDRAVGTWARFQGGIFLADPSITVKALPGLPDSGN